VDQPKNVEDLTRQGIYEAVTPYKNLPDVRLAKLRYYPTALGKTGKGTRCLSDLPSK
jgi:hypothetical protein